MNGVGAAPSASASRWQAAVAAVSLTLASLCVALPVAAAGLTLVAIVVWAAGAAALSAVGAVSAPILDESFELAAALLAAALIASAVGAVTGRTRPALPGAPGGSTETRPGKWALRHPWISAALIAFFIDAGLVPAHAGGARGVPTGILGAGILAGAALVWIFAAYGALRAWWLGVRLFWGAARRSAFSAGAVTAGSLMITVAALLVGYGLAQAAQVLSAPRDWPACSGSLRSCSASLLRSFNEAGARPPQATPPAPAAPLGPAAQDDGDPEPPPSVTRCFEEMHRPGFDGRSARDEALLVARSYMRDPDAAEDVVHAMLLSVCLRNERQAIADLRPYLVRAVVYAAQRERRWSRRYCPLDLDDPT